MLASCRAPPILLCHWLAPPVLMEMLVAVGRRDPPLGRRDPPPVDMREPPLGSRWEDPGCGRE